MFVFLALPGYLIFNLIYRILWELMGEEKVSCTEKQLRIRQKVPFTREYVGDTPTEMFSHFFKSLSSSARCNLRIEASGENNHHLAEAVFKAFARALRQGVKRDVFKYELPSSKGLI